MKIFITAILLIASVQVFAAEKKVICIAGSGGKNTKEIQADLGEPKARIDFGTINGLEVSVSAAENSSSLTLEMVDVRTMNYFSSSGSFGENGEPISLIAAVNNKSIHIVCALLK